AVVIHAEIFPAVILRRAVLWVPAHESGVAKSRVAVAVIEPVGPVADPQPAPVPAIALREQCQRFQIGGARNGAPRTARFRLPSPVHREIEEVLAVRGEIAPALVDATLQPLAGLKCVTSPIPEDC